MLGHVVILCSAFEKTVFQSGYTILQSYQQFIRIPISLLPSQHLLLYVLFILSILVAMKWYHFGFDLHFPNANDVEHLFVCLSTLSMSALMNLKVIGLEITTTLEYFPKSFFFFILGSPGACQNSQARDWTVPQQ